MSEMQESASSGKIDDAEEQATGLEKEDSPFRTAARVIHDGKTIAQRWCKGGVGAAESFAGKATDHIKDAPVRSAGISFVIGLSLGALIAWSMRHQSGVPVHDDAA